MMDGEAIEALYDKFGKPQVVTQDNIGRCFVPAGWTEIKRDVPNVEHLTVGTLTGFVDYLPTTDLVGGHPLQWGAQVDAETFFIALQTGFVATPDREALLLLVASIRENSVRETVDDGVAQEVKTGRGVALVGNTRIPNPVRLAPFRTFRDVEQPSSLFVLRAYAAAQGSDRPRLALFEADGGTWKLDAIQEVAAYLREKLGELITVIA
jgi:hypothetical protein